MNLSDNCSIATARKSQTESLMFHGNFQQSHRNALEIQLFMKIYWFACSAIVSFLRTVVLSVVSLRQLNAATFRREGLDVYRNERNRKTNPRWMRCIKKCERNERVCGVYARAREALKKFFWLRRRQRATRIMAVCVVKKYNEPTIPLPM